MGNHDLGTGKRGGALNFRSFLCGCACGFFLNAAADDFTLGLYSVHPVRPETIRPIAENGVDCLFNYVDLLAHPEQAKALLDAAATYRMKAALQVIRSRRILQDPNHLEKLRTAIRKYRRHPGLGMWYLFDEPDAADRDALLPVYRMLKQETPEIPVALCLAWRKKYQVYADCADILMPDLYPVKDQAFPNAPLNHFSHFIWSVASRKKPMIPVAQIMSYINYPKYARKADPDRCREPNADELRYFSFSAVALGSAGIAYYSYNDLVRQNHLPYFRSTVLPVIREVRQFTDAAAGMTFCWHGKKFGVGTPPRFFCASWQKGGAGFVVLVNNTGKKAGGDFTLMTPLPPGELTPWGITRPVRPEKTGSGLRLPELDPWEVLIWTFQPESGPAAAEQG